MNFLKKLIYYKDLKPLLCSNCFHDNGLKYMASRIGIKNMKPCPKCKTNDSVKLNKNLLHLLAHNFFVRGTVFKSDYGAAPQIVYNEQNYGSNGVIVSDWLKSDINLIEETLKIGFFHYGPRLWMIGEVNPLISLQDHAQRHQVIEEIIEKYPTRILNNNESFYRLRKNPNSPENFSEYDSPPDLYCGKGRLDSNNFPVMYGSQDIEVCVHECRVTVEDESFIASLKPQHDLKLLDLTEIIDEDSTEFDSIDIAVHMLFLAGEHSYEITRDIARTAKNRLFDGIIYPSYFSLVRTGSMPFDTIYGISMRRIPQTKEFAKSQTIPNVALFGRPIQDEVVSIKCINRIVLNKIDYDIHFGPVSVQ